MYKHKDNVFCKWEIAINMKHSMAIALPNIVKLLFNEMNWIVVQLWGHNIEDIIAKYYYIIISFVIKIYSIKSQLRKFY